LGGLTGSAGGAGFAWYMVAIGGVGALGAIDALRTLSHYLLALILISIVLSNRGVFATFTAALKALPTTAQQPASTSLMTPAQGIRKGAGGVGIDWSAGPLNAWNTVKSWFGGTSQ
jgi:hypothetical protein